MCNCPLSLCKEAAGLLRSISERLNPPRLAFPPCGRRARSRRLHGTGARRKLFGSSSEARSNCPNVAQSRLPSFHPGHAASHVSPDAQQVLPSPPPHRISSHEFTAALGLRSSWSFMARRADTYSCSIMHSASDVGIVAVEWFRCVPCNVGVPSFDSCQELRSHVTRASALITPRGELTSSNGSSNTLKHHLFFVFLFQDEFTMNSCPKLKKNY